MKKRLICILCAALCAAPALPAAGAEIDAAAAGEETAADAGQTSCAAAEDSAAGTESDAETVAADEQPAADDAAYCRAAWDEGNRAYIDGDYEKAAACYVSIAERGRYSMKLYYNLANAYFKRGETARAVLYYNRALKLDPSNDDVRYNLAIAEARTKDRIEAVPEFFLNRWLRTVRNSMSCTAWSLLSLASLAAIAIFVLLFLLAGRIAVRKTGFYGAIIALAAFAATTSFALAERSDMLRREEAVVMSSAISVKSSPDRSATDLFVLHEGTKVRIASEIDGWYEIVIADGKKGWTESRNIEQI